MAKLLIFNWKMNPETVEEAVSLAKASDYENTVIVPPFLFIEEVGKVFGVTRERIRQIEAKALRKLRHPSRSRKLRDYLE